MGQVKKIITTTERKKFLDLIQPFKVIFSTSRKLDVLEAKANAWGEITRKFNESVAANENVSRR